MFRNRLVLTSMLKWKRFYLFSSKLLMTLLPTSFVTHQDNVVFGTCGKNIKPTQVSIRIQNEVFSESTHCLLIARLRGSAVQSLVLLNRGVIKTFEMIADCVEKAYFSIGTVCYSLDSTTGVSKRA